MPTIITERLAKHKRLFEALFLPLVVVLVGLTAFGLGRLSVTGIGPLGEQVPAATYQPVDATTGKYVGSKSGTKYYLPSCSGVASIKLENRVWFISAAEAEAAGYSPAANCAGL